MSDNYLANLIHVVVSPSVDAKVGRASFTTLQSHWGVIERQAASLQYDVLNIVSQAIWPADGQIAGAIWRMTRSLYSLYDDPELQAVLDIRTLIDKDTSYGTSWKKRGGQGAFFVTTRKWDRILNQVQENAHDADDFDESWERLIDQPNARDKDGIWDDIDDLRCYLLLWAAERAHRAKTVIPPHKTFSVIPAPSQQCGNGCDYPVGHSGKCSDDRAHP